MCECAKNEERTRNRNERTAILLDNGRAHSRECMADGVTAKLGQLLSVKLNNAI
jgi:hypothetical protein